MSRWRTVCLVSAGFALVATLTAAGPSAAAMVRRGPAMGVRTATRSFVAARHTFRAVRTGAPARRHSEGDSIGHFTEFALPEGNSPEAMTPGPDGNVWFTENTLPVNVGRITPDGVVTLFEVGTYGASNSITTGPDGALWFTCRSKSLVFRITVEGVITEYAIQDRYGSASITVGPDGALWFTELLPLVTRYGYIGRLTTDGILSEYLVPVPWAYPNSITSGPDGNVWFNEQNGIGRITPSGVVTTYPVPIGGDPSHVAGGPDGNVWFTYGAGAGAGPGPGIGKVQPDGQIGIVPEGCGECSPSGIVAAADGRMWFVDWALSTINRIAGLPPGGITTFRTPTPRSGPLELCRGPDGNIWFGEPNTNKIAMVTDEPISAARFTPTTGPPGTAVNVTGTNYGSFEPVDVTYVDRVSGTTLLATLRTDSIGAFATTVQIPLTASQGVQGLRTTGEISGLVRQHSFTVS